MKIKDIKEKDDATLNADLLGLAKELYTLRTQAVTQKLEDPSKISKVKKDVARIKTVQTQRKLAQDKAASAAAATK